MTFAPSPATIAVTSPPAHPTPPSKIINVPTVALPNPTAPLAMLPTTKPHEPTVKEPSAIPFTEGKQWMFAFACLGVAVVVISMCCIVKQSISKKPHIVVIPQADGPDMEANDREQFSVTEFGAPAKVHSLDYISDSDDSVAEEEMVDVFTPVGKTPLPTEPVPILAPPVGGTGAVRVVADKAEEPEHEDIELL
eukprot:Platyproteum_vivax@DN3110_c0_g1_i1.p1